MRTAVAVRTRVEVYHGRDGQGERGLQRPPINLGAAEQARTAAGCRRRGIPVADHMRSLPPGTTGSVWGEPIEVVYRSDTGPRQRDLKLAEINGSETYVHARHHDFTMIAQLEGVRQFA